MARTHNVTSGECSSSIAAQYGMRSFRTVYECSENEGLREARPDPNVLAPGDTVVIPDREPRVETGATEARHRFRTVSNRAALHVRLLRHDNEAFDYEVWVDGALAGKGATDAAHPIGAPIDPRAVSAELRLWPSDSPEAHTLENACILELTLGELNPVNREDGVQQRLKNLGYYHGEINDVLTPETAEAIRRFERDHGAIITGVPSPWLSDKLLTVHDRP